MAARILDLTARLADRRSTGDVAAPTLEAPKFVPAYCDPRNEVRGEKFDRRLSTKEVAEKIRADVKALRASGKIDASAKVSVRYESFAGGTAIRVSVTEWAGRIYSPAWVEATAFGKRSLDYASERTVDRYTAEARALLDLLTRTAKAYGRDNSDPSSDYFDVNFYGGDAGFDWRLERDELDRLRFEAELPVPAARDSAVAS